MAYFNGEGVRQDRLKAIEMFKVAALQNNSDSIVILGSLNENGEVLEKVLIRLSIGITKLQCLVMQRGNT